MKGLQSLGFKVLCPPVRIKIIPIDENLWLESVALEWSHKDPADRVIVALAKKYQADLITSDKIIMGFYNSVIW
ncbi:PIN domain-containing protein [Anabaena cylindrica UHCC 0172]|uniref:type II toxin-antitoxin system VapC family toxin n=1 Tax=Anabaena cylindrica TaxID=1165 RepID=UPI002B1EE1E0|nr:PIN domain-containing protein [Anabaena cylindrica]MEA5549908.1 PIN domain-containing protein [Anabaena cylindrica UHCC 0172]